MYARIRIYGLWLGVMLLMAACTQEERMPDIPAEAVAITFDCHTALDEGETRAANGATGFTTSENGNLYYMGLGVFARVEDATDYNFMWNQELEYVFLADITQDEFDLYDGYWTYTPIKYWPYKYDNVEQKNVPKTLYFSAYAPYVEKPDGLPAGTTGITGMSASSENPYIDYTLSDKLDETVDLLWSYLSPTSKPSVKGPVSLKMYHALARVAVALKLSAAPATDTKVLVRRITLIPTTLATSGKLNLTSHSTFTVDENEVVVPTWSNLTMLSGEGTKGDRTILIDHDPATTPESYCDISNDIRLIPGLPYSWQPEGLNETGYQNALTSESHQAYLYFIPQDAFTVTCTVAYTVFASDGTQTPGNKTMTTAATLADPLRGNLTYHLNLTIEI